MTELLIGAADRYHELDDTMKTELDRAHRDEARGLVLLTEMQKAIGNNDTAAYAADAVDAQDIIAGLATFRLTDRAKAAAAIHIDAALDSPAIAAARASVARITNRVIERADEIAQDRPTIVVPILRMIEPREATMLYAGSAALSGWVTAIFLDVLPLLLLGAVMTTSRERLMLRDRIRRETRPDPNDYDYGEQPQGTAAIAFGVRQSPAYHPNGEALTNGQDTDQTMLILDTLKKLRGQIDNIEHSLAK